MVVLLELAGASLGRHEVATADYGQQSGIPP
jgi:hypothetical protein